VQIAESATAQQARGGDRALAVFGGATGLVLLVLVLGLLSRLWRLVFAWRGHPPWAAESVSRDYSVR